MVLDGGPRGNEVLTTTNGAILIALLAALGLTIVRIGQLMNEHLFLGFLLVGPVILKLGSTGYRFVRYYAGDREYRRKGPPVLWMRAMAPAIVLLTLAVFVTGVALLVVGPAGRSVWLLLHKVSFIAWLVLMSLHVLGHLHEVGGLFARRAGRSAFGGAGAAGRVIALSGAIVAGAVLALVLIPDYAVWAHYAKFHHHHHLDP